LDRRRVKTGEGIQLDVETRIEGLMQNVPEITLPDLDGFQVFPSTKDVKRIKRGERQINLRKQTWLLRPQRAGRLKIPAFSIAYFDPDSGRYKTARSRSLTVTVSGKPTAVPQTADKTELVKETIALRTIRSEVDGGTRVNRGRMGSVLLVIFFGAPLLFLGGLLTERFQLRRAAGAGERVARGAAHQAVQTLEKLPESSPDPTEGYSAINRIIIDYLEQRLEQSFRGLTQEKIADGLLARGIDGQTISALRNELDAADFARFARVTDVGDLRLAVQRAQGLINQIEEAL
jgi:hypothetical protein